MENGQRLKKTILENTENENIGKKGKFELKKLIEKSTDWRTKRIRNGIEDSIWRKKSLKIVDSVWREQRMEKAIVWKKQGV